MARRFGAEENTITLWSDRQERAFARLRQRAHHWTLEWGYRDPPASDNFIQVGEHVTSVEQEAVQGLADRIRQLSRERPKPQGSRASPRQEPSHCSTGDELERALIVLMDKEKARLFRITRGRIDLLDQFQDPVPGRHAQGGWSQSNFQRHQDTHVLWHAKQTVKRLEELAQRGEAEPILVGGPPEAVVHLLQQLPKALKERVAAHLPVEMFVSPSALSALAWKALRQAHRQKEARRISELVEQGGSTRAVFGIHNALKAAADRKVSCLVVAEGIRFPGTFCAVCSLMKAGGMPAACPVCGNTVSWEPDLLDRLTQRVHSQGGRHEIVREEAARRLLEQGGIAAMLQYSQSGRKEQQA